MLFSKGIILSGVAGGSIPTQTACLEPQSFAGSRSLVLSFNSSMGLSKPVVWFHINFCASALSKILNDYSALLRLQIPVKNGAK